MIRCRFTVRGRVQGVGFRWFVQSEADRAGVAGFVQNQPDGSVMCEVEADAAAVEQFAAVLRRGPLRARVDALERFEVPLRGERSFVIR